MSIVYTKHGFTLIELLVVISIIGILASVVLASLSTAREKAQISRAQTEILQIAKAVEIARIATGNKYMKDLTGSSYSWGGDLTEDQHATRLSTSFQNLRDATGGVSDGIENIIYDPWGMVYKLDENEGESVCSRDHIRTQNNLVWYFFEYGSQYCKDNPSGTSGFQ